MKWFIKSFTEEKFNFFDIIGMQALALGAYTESFVYIAIAIVCIAFSTFEKESKE